MTSAGVPTTSSTRPGRRSSWSTCRTTPDVPSLAWPVVGNFPGGRSPTPRGSSGTADRLKVGNTGHGLRTTIEITLPDAGDPVELWTITVENLSDAARSVKVVPYLEWVLNRPEADRGHTQYNRLFAEMEYVAGLHAVLAWDKHAKAMGLLASDVAAGGLPHRRGSTSSAGPGASGRPGCWRPWRSRRPRTPTPHPTFDPIGSLLIGLTVPARGSSRVRLLIGLAGDKTQAIDLIARHLAGPGGRRSLSPTRRRKTFHPIGHGEIPPGTPQPYSEFSEDGRTLLVRTPFTPRPFDHTMSNALGHVVAVTNRGLHTTSSVNSQQNRLTPDWPDTVTREVPARGVLPLRPRRGGVVLADLSPAERPRRRA